ncbi:uncharacterized protein BCR38DRAFT_306975, partial [Pseudomassariella vexata]
SSNAKTSKSGTSTKRGRPKGWKPGMSYAAMRGNPTPKDWSKDRPKQAASRNYGTETRRRGRQPQATGLAIKQRYLRSKPGYLSFGCEWQESTNKRCPAELQNMETLRKHVYFIHGDAEPLVCFWGKCGQQKTPPEFVVKEEFRKHVEKAHLVPYAWHAGDGPQNKGIWTLKNDRNKLPSHLFDKDGKQVTPSVKDQLLEDTKGMLERKRKLREIRRQADENAPDE